MNGTPFVSILRTNGVFYMPRKQRLTGSVFLAAFFFLLCLFPLFLFFLPYNDLFYMVAAVDECKGKEEQGVPSDQRLAVGYSVGEAEDQGENKPVEDCRNTGADEYLMDFPFPFHPVIPAFLLFGFCRTGNLFCNLHAPYRR